MSNSKNLHDHLVKLGHVSPELRPHLTPVLDTLTREASGKVEVEHTGKDECVIECALKVTEGNRLSYYQDLAKGSLVSSAKEVHAVMKKHSGSDFASIYAPGSDPRLISRGGHLYLALSVEIRGISAQEAEKWLTKHTNFRITLYA